jgi:hypothetical protein
LRAKTANPAQASDAEKDDKTVEAKMAANEQFKYETEKAGQKTQEKSVHGFMILGPSREAEGKKKRQKAFEPGHQSRAHAGGKTIYCSLVGRTADMNSQRGGINCRYDHQDGKTKGDYCERAADDTEPSDFRGERVHSVGVSDRPNKVIMPQRDCWHIQIPDEPESGHFPSRQNI